MKPTRHERMLGIELARLRLQAGLTTPQHVERKTRRRLNAATVTMLEQGSTGRPSVGQLRLLAETYGVTPWSLLKLAGYVTDQDALDGVAEMKRSKRAA